VVWFTGLPASGKSTLAGHLQARLRRAGVPTCMLDGDQVRACVSPAPGYDPAGRDHLYATLGNLAVLLAGQDLITLVPATAHLRRYRDAVRARVQRFIEVHVAASAAVCAQRDVKRLYEAARRAQLQHLPGVHESYEPPLAPEVVAEGGDDRTALLRLETLLLPTGAPRSE
jgi:adenylylsulfate kinase